MTPLSTLHAATASQHVISTHVHVFDYKTKHVEPQRVLPAFAYALSCTQLQLTPRPHSFVNIQDGGKRRERPRGLARGPRGVQDSRLLAPRPEYVVSKNREQILNLQHQAVFNKIRSPALHPAHGHLQQHQRQPGGDRRERRGRLRAAEGIADVQVHHGPLGQGVRAA